MTWCHYGFVCIILLRQHWQNQIYYLLTIRIVPTTRDFHFSPWQMFGTFLYQDQLWQKHHLCLKWEHYQVTFIDLITVTLSHRFSPWYLDLLPSSLEITSRKKLYCKMSKYLRTENLTAVQHQDIILSAPIKNLPRTWTCVGLHIIVL